MFEGCVLVHPSQTWCYTLGLENINEVPKPSLKGSHRWRITQREKEQSLLTWNLTEVTLRDGV